jgi:hypothetical protein
MARFEEQHVCFRLCFKLGETATDTLMLKLAFEDETVNRTQTFDWFFKFKSEVTFVDGTGH